MVLMKSLTVFRVSKVTTVQLLSKEFSVMLVLSAQLARITKTLSLTCKSQLSATCPQPSTPITFHATSVLGSRTLDLIAVTPARLVCSAHRLVWLPLRHVTLVVIAISQALLSPSNVTTVNTRPPPSLIHAKLAQRTTSVGRTRSSLQLSLVPLPLTFRDNLVPVTP